MTKPLKPAWNPRFTVTWNARRTLPRIVRAYFTQVRDSLSANPGTQELHAIRLATKKLRYTLELFRPCYGQGLETRLAALQRLQQVLGELNDCAAAERLIESLAANPVDRARAVEFLKRRASAKTAEFQREWRDRFDAPGRENWWLRYLSTNVRPREPRL